MQADQARAEKERTEIPELKRLFSPATALPVFFNAKPLNRQYIKKYII